MLVRFGVLQPQRMARRDPLHILCFALLACRLWVRAHPGLCRRILRHNRTRPGHHVCLLTLPLLQLVQVAQQMHPAALMLASILVVAAVEVTDQMTAETAIQQTLESRLHTATAVLVIAHSMLSR